jgi:hypothetical protein
MSRLVQEPPEREVRSMGLRIMRAFACVATKVVLAASAARAGAETTTPTDVGPASLNEGAGDPNLVGVVNHRAPHSGGEVTVSAEAR